MIQLVFFCLKLGMLWGPRGRHNSTFEGIMKGRIYDPQWNRVELMMLAMKSGIVFGLCPCSFPWLLGRIASKSWKTTSTVGCHQPLESPATGGEGDDGDQMQSMGTPPNPIRFLPLQLEDAPRLKRMLKTRSCTSWGGLGHVKVVPQRSP